MKTKEFIKKVEKLGFEIICYTNPYANVKSNCKYNSIGIYLHNELLVEVWTNCQYAISTISDGHSCYLYGYDVDELYKLCFEYASTPVEDREEEKEFYLKHKWLRSDDFNYLCFDKIFEIYSLNPCGFRELKTEYTEKEIEKLKEKFNTDLSDFEIVEVEDDAKTN